MCCSFPPVRDHAEFWNLEECYEKALFGLLPFNMHLMLTSWRQNIQHRWAFGLTGYCQGCSHCSIYSSSAVADRMVPIFPFMLEELKHRKTKVLLPEESNPVCSQFQSSALILTRSGLPCATVSGVDLALRVCICEQTGYKRSRVVTVLPKDS